MSNSSVSLTQAALRIVCTAAAFSCAAGARAASPLEAWVQRYNTTSTVLQEGYAVAFAPNGDVAVTGLQFVQSNEAFYTAKYSGTTGALLWDETYDSENGDDVPASVVVDSQGHVIVTGYRTNGSGIHDFYTIKYSSSNGTVIWEKSYDNAEAGGLDEAVKVVVDSNDNVIVTGVSAGQGTQQDIQTIKYRASDGFVLNQWRYNSPGNRTERPTDLTIDADDNPVVVGEANIGDEVWFYTGRYNGTGGPGAKHWEKVKTDLPAPSYYGAFGVAVDGDGNVFTVGRIRQSDITFESLTVKYAAADGAVLWDEFSGAVKLDNGTDPIDIAVDGAGNAIVGFTRDSTAGNTIHVVKYNGASGAILWDEQTTAPGDDDTLAAVAVDPQDNVVIAGTSRNALQVGASDDYYVQRRDGVDGSQLFQDRRNGDNESGEDTLIALALDGGGNIVVTGRSRKPPEVQGNTFQMLTVKYGESLIVSPFLLVTGDPTPQAGVVGSGIPAGSVLKTLNPPALADTGDFATLVGFSAPPKKTLKGILHQGSFAAVQGLPAPGVTGATFSNFENPVVSPNARVAFKATIAGAPRAQQNGIWTNVFNGTLQCALQTGKPIPALDDVTIIAITSLSIRNNHLLALVKLGGSGVNRGNSVGLIGMTTLATPRFLLRTGEPLTIDSKASTIKSLSVLAPVAGTDGHGRFHADTRTVARVTLADKRSVIVRVEHNGTIAPLIATGGPSTEVVAQSTWKTLGYPSHDTTGGFLVCAGTLSGTGINAANDAVLTYKDTNFPFDLSAREGQIAPDVNGAPPTGGPVFASFMDPINNNQGFAAFLATLRGAGVSGANNSGIFFGEYFGNFRLVVRKGDPATDRDGNPTTAKFSSFDSLGLPGGTSATPIFLAKIKGAGVGGKNNAGLWGVNSSTNKTQRIIGTGDIIGDATITRITLLRSLPTVYGETRSFNTTDGVAVHLVLNGKTQAILLLKTPTFP